MEVGKPAGIVVIDAQSPEQVIAEIAQPVAAFKHGRQTVGLAAAAAAAGLILRFG